MKIILIITCLLVLIGNGYSQSIPSSKPLTQEDYLKKSKDQTTTGLVLIGGGLTLIVIGGVIASQNLLESNPSDAILPVVGLGATLCSIPLFISAGKNKRKGMSLSFKNETAPYFQNGSNLSKSVPALSLKIGL